MVKGSDSIAVESNEFSHHPLLLSTLAFDTVPREFRIADRIAFDFVLGI